MYGDVGLLNLSRKVLTFRHVNDMIINNNNHHHQTTIGLIPIAMPVTDLKTRMNRRRVVMSSLDTPYTPKKQEFSLKIAVFCGYCKNRRFGGTIASIIKVKRISELER
jgi:hypothetical protein